MFVHAEMTGWNSPDCHTDGLSKRKNIPYLQTFKAAQVSVLMRQF